MLLRANVYYQLNDTDHALEDVEAVIARQPQLLVAHLLQAEIFAGTKRVDQAIEQLGETGAARAEPDSAAGAAGRVTT